MEETNKSGMAAGKKEEAKGLAQGAGRKLGELERTHGKLAAPRNENY